MATTLVGSDIATVSAPSTRDSGSTSCLRAMCAGTRLRISGLITCWRTSTDGSPCSRDSTSTRRSSVTRPRRARTAPSRSFERRCSRSASCSCSCEMTPSATSSSPSRARVARLRAVAAAAAPVFPVAIDPSTGAAEGVAPAIRTCVLGGRAMGGGGAGAGGTAGAGLMCVVCAGGALDRDTGGGGAIGAAGAMGGGDAIGGGVCVRVAGGAGVPLRPRPPTAP